MKKVFVCTLCLIITLSSCDYFIYIKYNNQSNRTILGHVSYSSYDAVMCPDTVLHDGFTNPISINPDTIKSGETKLVLVTIWGRSGTIPAFYNAIQCDTVCYFVVDADTVAYYGVTNVSDNYRILVRYDLNIDDVELLKETIPYPPTPAMRDMKMYPPYEEVLRREEEYNKQHNILQP